MTASRSLPAALAALLLAACAGPDSLRLSPPPERAAPSGQPSVAAAAASEPGPVPAAAVELDAELLYRILAAELAATRGLYGEAVDRFLDLARELRDVRLVKRAARLATYTHDVARSVAAARLWVELAPRSLEAHQVLAAFQLRAGRLEEARRALERVLELAGERGENGLRLVAGLLGRQVDKAEALALLRELIEERAAQDAGAWLSYARLAARAGNAQAAEEGARRSLEADPGRWEAALFLAQVLHQAGRAAEAAGVLEDAIRRRPQEASLREAYARVLVAQERYREALAQYRELSRLRPEDRGVLYLVAILSLELEQVDEGERILRRLYEEGVRRDEVAYYLGRVAQEFRGDRHEALKWYDRVGGGTRHLEAVIRAAVLAAETGDVEGALARLRAFTPTTTEQLLRLMLAEGAVLRDAGRLEEALAVYDAGLEELPDNVDLLYARAMTLDKLGRFPQVEADLRRILELDPDHYDALNALGYMLTEHTRRYEEALGYIRRALELKPDSYYILDSMGWVQYRLGRYQEAIRYLRRALQLGRDPEIAAHLTEVLWVSGDREGARRVWKEALEAAPGDKLLMELMDRLDRGASLAPAPEPR